jgi:hypothetical protein
MPNDIENSGIDPNVKNLQVKPLVGSSRAVTTQFQERV